MKLLNYSTVVAPVSQPARQVAHSNTGGALSYGLAFPNNVQLGNLMIVYAINASGTLTIGDTLSTVWNAFTSPKSHMYGWWGIALSGGANTITITSSLSSAIYLDIAEYATNGGTVALDGVGDGTGASPYTLSSSAATGTQDLVVALLQGSGGGLSSSLAGWTMEVNYLAGYYQILSQRAATSGAQSIVITVGSGTPYGIIANFNITSAGTAPNAILGGN